MCSSHDLKLHLSKDRVLRIARQVLFLFVYIYKCLSVYLFIDSIHKHTAPSEYFKECLVPELMKMTLEPTVQSMIYEAK